MSYAGFLGLGQPAGSPGLLMDLGNIPNAAIYFVKSGGVNAAGGGRTPDAPLATIDYAIGLCSAGDIILVDPSHAETIAAGASIAIDVAGIQIIGQGIGKRRPLITMSGTTSIITISVANVVYKNIRHVATAQVVKGVSVAAAGAVLEDLEFIDGADQFTTPIDVGSGGAANLCDNTTIRRCVIKSVAAGAAQGIELGEVADGVTIEDCRVKGAFSVAGIHNPTGKVLTDLLIRRNHVRNTATGKEAINLVSACTGEASDNRGYSDIAGAATFVFGSLFLTENYGGRAVSVNGILMPAIA